jgi:hypothetical protein
MKASAAGRRGLVGQSTSAKAVPGVTTTAISGVHSSGAAKAAPGLQSHMGTILASPAPTLEELHDAHPVLLCCDAKLQNLPWESLPGLSNQR